MITGATTRPKSNGQRLELVSYLHRAIQSDIWTLASLGAVEITRAEYHRQLSEAIERKADFTGPPTPSAQGVIQRSTQMS